MQDQIQSVDKRMLVRKLNSSFDRRKMTNSQVAIMNNIKQTND